MTDHQATLGVILVLVLAVLAFAGFRSARKGKIDDSLFGSFEKRVKDQQGEIEAAQQALVEIREQLDADRKARLAAEDAARASELKLSRRITELEGKLERATWLADVRKGQLEAAGLVPVL